MNEPAQPMAVLFPGGGELDLGGLATLRALPPHTMLDVRVTGGVVQRMTVAALDDLVTRLAAAMRERISPPPPNVIDLFRKKEE